ncbi:hypothetical protein BD289DRAFT_296469 [Coniella lustricola]|uniref:Uncharacterized protein n=1 Tax=Coniella lustricola TaxID=2025994 RepID=A0A2T3A4R7_9PEZI|nr:hypothetical protein BD289DRAFT_296469 [Coniella lustricola]
MKPNRIGCPSEYQQGSHISAPLLGKSKHVQHCLGTHVTTSPWLIHPDTSSNTIDPDTNYIDHDTLKKGTTACAMSNPARVSEKGDAIPQSRNHGTLDYRACYSHAEVLSRMSSLLARSGSSWLYLADGWMTAAFQTRFGRDFGIGEYCLGG